MFSFHNLQNIAYLHSTFNNTNIRQGVKPKGKSEKTGTVIRTTYRAFVQKHSMDEFGIIRDSLGDIITCETFLH